MSDNQVYLIRVQLQGPPLNMHAEYVCIGRTDVMATLHYIETQCNLNVRHATGLHMHVYHWKRWQSKEDAIAATCITSFSYSKTLPL